MKKLVMLAECGALLFLLTSCGAVATLFSSDKAYITSFTFDGIVGDAVIDAENRTVTITAETMDVRNIDPTITISEGATIIEPAEIKDGEAVTYAVTAENGDIVNWDVTITAQIGIKLIIDDTTYNYTDGFSTNLFDESDPSSPDLSELGSAKAMYYPDGDNTYYEAYAFSREIDNDWYKTGDKIIRIMYAPSTLGDNIVVLNFIEIVDNGNSWLIDDEQFNYSYISESNIGKGNSQLAFSGTYENSEGSSVSVSCFINAPVTKWSDVF